MHTFLVSFFVHDGARRFAWEIQKVLAFYPVLMIMCLAVMIVKFLSHFVVGWAGHRGILFSCLPLWE